jgi:hypothetical protein
LSVYGAAGGAVAGALDISLPKKEYWKTLSPESYVTGLYDHAVIRTLSELIVH